MNSTNKYKSSFSFAVIKNDGSIVTWGSEYNLANQYVPINTKNLGGITDAKQISSTDWGAFAAFREGGSVVTWGSSAYGGDSSKVATQLTNIDKIYSNAQAFAVLKNDKSVVAWGNAINGGDISKVTGLNDVEEIYSTATAFAAVKDDGSVVTWGNPYYGGVIPTNLVIELDGKNENGENKDVVSIFATNTAFAALRADGSVVTWGDANSGGNSTADATLAKQLDGIDDTKDVTKIFSTNTAFAALRVDGSVVTWGNAAYGGNSTLFNTDLVDVQKIYSNDVSFSALTSSSLLWWGSSGTYGSISSSLTQLDGVALDTKPQPNGVFKTPLDGVAIKEIYSTGTAFAALRADGSVMTWGNVDAGGDSSVVKDALAKHNVTQIFSTYNSFAALRKDGSVITWGQGISGGDSSKVAKELNGDIDVVKIFSNDYSFAALRQDGSVITWGNSIYGGNSSTVKDKLTSEVKIFANELPNNLPTGSVTVDGVPKEGETLTASNTLADLDGLGEIISYQWLRDNSEIKDETKSTYTLTANDIGKTISVKASYTDKLNTPESIASSSTKAVEKFVAPVPVVSTKPTNGNDLLTGTKSNEKLDALAGNDTLIGGEGVDTLTGGKGTDVFKYNKFAESSATKPDTITDFNHSENDKIDLSKIDTNSKSTGDQAFTFIDTNKFSNVAGQLRFEKGKVEADTNGDGKADFAILITGVTELSAADFVL